MNSRLFLFAACIFGMCVAFIATCSRSAAGESALSGTLTVFHAGSLAVPMKKMGAEFNKIHPDVKILSEAAGSRDCARKISELKRPCDVMASADYKVIDQMLIPAHADWNIRFAANEMTIVYHDASRRAKELTAENWHQLLHDKTVAFGRADPNADPCGYRAVLTMKLAEKYYKQPGLAAKVLAKDMCFIRPQETDLLALLEAGAIDYIFLYRSVAQQHGLKFLVLPDEVNLKNPAHAEWYGSVSVKLSGKKSGETIEQKGEPMVYGVTIPKGSPNRAAAVAFVRFLLEKEHGRKILEDMGQPSVIPAVATGYDLIPEILKSFAKDTEKDVADAEKEASLLPPRK